MPDLEPPHIKLGDVTAPVYAQKIGRLARKLPTTLVEQFATATDSGTDGLLEQLGGSAYSVLCVLVPALEKRMTQDEFLDEEHGATVPELRAAFRTACEVNEISDLPGMLGKVLGPAGTALLRAQAFETMLGSGESSTSPSTIGESESTSSGTSPRTETASEVSPSPVSVA